VPNACESDRIYEADELEFMLAVRRYQEAALVKFPTLCELLAILKQLGYRKAGGDDQ
jgi:hypothetical protein